MVFEWDFYLSAELVDDFELLAFLTTFDDLLHHTTAIHVHGKGDHLALHAGTQVTLLPPRAKLQQLLQQQLGTSNDNVERMHRGFKEQQTPKKSAM